MQLSSLSTSSIQSKAKPISVAIAATSFLAISGQTMAEQEQTLPVKELSTFEKVTTLEELKKQDFAGLQIEETRYQKNKNGNITAHTEITNRPVNLNEPIPKPFLEQKQQIESTSSVSTNEAVAKTVTVVTPTEINAPTITTVPVKVLTPTKVNELPVAPELVTTQPKTPPVAPVDNPAEVVVTQPPVSVPVTKPQPTKPQDGVGVDAKDTDNSNDEVIDTLLGKDGKIYKTVNLGNYAKQVNAATWTKGMKKNTAMTVKLQALLDWNHASPGPVDGGWGMNSKKALKNFQAMRGLPTTGKMDEATWTALNKNIDSSQPVLMSYKLTAKDTNYQFTQLPSGYEAKSKLKALNYQNIYEKIAEEYHMDIKYLKKLNKGKKFTTGETITVYNPGKKLQSRITRVVANKADKTLYAYSGKKLIATYPTTVGSAATPSPHGTFKIANRVKKPHYRATVGEGDDKKIFMLKPGPNSPVGIVWMGLSKPTYGIHGSPKPEGISRQQSHGCIRLTNWDALEVRENIRVGATVELK